VVLGPAAEELAEELAEEVAVELAVEETTSANNIRRWAVFDATEADVVLVPGGKNP
jgi:hypothetical protein